MPDSQDPIIELSGVTRTFKRGGGDFAAVQDICLKLKKGEVAVFSGPSGSGKTTLLNLIGGLVRPSSGSLNVCGRELHKLGESGLADFRRRKVGFVFQAFRLIETKTALANVMLPLKFSNLPAAEARQRAEEQLARVGLADIRGERVATFSAGQKQRTALARALVNKPELLIADEPTGNLDQDNSKAVFEILYRNASEEGRTVLIATHDMDMLPAGDTRHLALENGRIGHAAAAD